MVRFKRIGWQGLKKLLIGLLCIPLLALAAEPRIVASIKPIHSLVANIMQGVGEPLLLVAGGASPHDYSLKPSEVRAINQAQVVFWIGPSLESFLLKPLDQAQDRVRAVALLDTPGLSVLPLRQGGAWEPHTHDHDAQEQAMKGDDHVLGYKADRDPHIWLDPINAIVMARQIVAVLSEIDAAHRADYQRNGAALIEALEQLNRQLAIELAPVQKQPYLVFHDAYQYFERRYGLNSVGSVVVSAAQQPGARRVAEIQARIRDLQVHCLFSEPQFQPVLVDTLVANSTVHREVLDPLGAELPAGPDAYFQLLRSLATALRGCLSNA